jgi:hypothetical protein
LVQVHESMGKRVEKNLEDVHDSKRFRNNLSDVFLTGAVSAQRTQTLFSDALKAGADHVDHLAAVKSEGRNQSRDLMRQLNRHRNWPNIYESKIRTWNVKKQVEEESWLPVMLPSELLASLTSVGSIEVLRSRARLDGTSREHVRKVERDWGVEEGSLVAFGFWLDGVATGWDRSESLEVFSIYLPGLPPPFNDLRFPITAIHKKFVLPGATMDDICEVIAKDAVNLMLGEHMRQRLDGEAWRQSDARRRRRSGKSLGSAGLICSIVPDWAMLKSVCRFPQHNEKQGFITIQNIIKR